MSIADEIGVTPGQSAENGRVTQSAALPYTRAIVHSVILVRRMPNSRVVIAMFFIMFAVMTWRGRAATLTPVYGTPQSLPGTILAADFDEGGAGIAYGDSTTGNSGGVYRQTDVDLESSA